VDEESRVIQVELPRDRYDELKPNVGEQLYVKPRRLRVFLNDKTLRN
jgi:hypothetical protein